jgi:hypothetical protein
MIKRYCGDLEIGLHFTGYTKENRANYMGYIKLPDGRKYQFKDLQSGCGSPGVTPEAIDEMAVSAVGFAAYWTSDNRGDETPEWAPSEEMADAIADAAELGESEYEIRRKQTDKSKFAREMELLQNAIDSLREYYGPLVDDIWEIRAAVTVPNTGNDQSDYQNVRDQIEIYLQRDSI